MSILQWLKEQWLLGHGWERIDYPFPRGDVNYLYTVYSHPDFTGVWPLQSAWEKAHQVEEAHQS